MDAEVDKAKTADALWSLSVPKSQAREAGMHARVTTIVGSADQVDAGTSDFRDTVIPWVKEQGGRGGILLIDRGTGKAMAVTLWSDEENMRQSEEAANEHRRRVSDEMQSTQSPTIERYEVAVFEA